MTISSCAINTPRTHARYIFIYKYSENELYDIAVLDDEYNYYEFNLKLPTAELTKSCIKNIHTKFNRFLITKDTEIDMLDSIQKTDKLYLYLKIMNSNVFANMKIVSLDMIPRRIVAYHRSYLNSIKTLSKVTRRHIELLWNKLLELEKCPWITDEINLHILNTSAANIKRQHIIRVGLYYMIVKRFLVEKSIKSRDKIR